MADVGADTDSAQVRLPSMRRESPWSRRLLLIVVVTVALFAPVWLDPVTLDQFRGATPFPLPSEPPPQAEPSSPATPDGEEPFTVAATVARDDFERDVPVGWGTAKRGGAYTAIGSPDLLSARDGEGMGRFQTGQTVGAVLSDVTAHDVEVVFDVSGDALPTDGVFVAALLRVHPDGASYRPLISIGAEGVVSVGVTSVVGGVETELVPVVAAESVVVAPGTRLRVRAQALDADPTTVRLRVWPADAAEPVTWQLSVIDWSGSLQSEGAIGLGWGATGSTSLPGGAAVEFDDLVARANAEQASL